MRPIVLIVGHGSRDPAANQEFEQLVTRYQAHRPDIELRHAYIELARPSLDEALADVPTECDEVTILPLFLFAAGHVKNDLPLALATARGRRPAVRFRAAREIGVHTAMVELALERAGEAISPGPADLQTSVVVVGRGSSDAEANGDFCKLARLLAERRAFAWVVPAFIGIARPRFEEALDLMACTQPERLLVIPYLLFGGRLLTQLEEQAADFRMRYPSIETTVAPHLGVHHRLLEVLDDRLTEVGKC